MAKASLARGAEPLVALLEQFCSGPGTPAPGKGKPQRVEALKSMQEGWPVLLIQDIGPYLNDEVGPDPENVAVESTMMNRAHRDTVRDDRLASIPVFLDVRSVEKLGVSEAAQGALASVCRQDAMPEPGLMQASFHFGDCVLAS